MEEQLNLSTYLEDRATGSVRMVKLHGVPQALCKAFCPKTGAPRSTLIPLDTARITAQLEALKATAASLQVLLADIEAASDLIPSGETAAAE